MKNYWLYLEPYSFLFNSNGSVVLYNTISNQGKRFNCIGKVKAIVESLMVSENMYCVNITEDDLKDSNLMDFIGYIRDTFSGDLIDASSCAKKPVVMVPKFKINKTIEQLHSTEDKLLSDDILSYINELSIYIGGGKPSSMLLDIPVYKQFDYNKGLDETLPLNDALHFISQLKYAPLGVINIFGGNIFTYPWLNDFVKEVKSIKVSKLFGVCYNDIPSNLNQYDFLLDKMVKLRIMVDFPLNHEKLDHVVMLVKLLGIKTEWLFAIATIDEFEEAEEFIKRYKLEKAFIKPVYTGKNLQLFADNVYLDEEDILSTYLSRNDIFMKQVLNTYDFGKLTLMADGKVYANVNHQPIGNFNEPIAAKILKELSNTNSWRRIRDQKPCDKCVYQWLCPPPSNYELVIDKPNLCTISPSILEV